MANQLNCGNCGGVLDEDDNSYTASAEDGFTIRLHYRTLHDGTVDVDLMAPK